MKKIMLTIIAFTLMAMFTFSITSEASSTKVMWGKTELKKGQIGKVTILKDTPLLHIGKDPMLDGGAVRELKKGEEYRVYSTKTPEGYFPMYNVGGEYYVVQNSTLNGVNVKFETPSKAKLALLEDSSPKVMWGKTELKVGQIGKVTLSADVATFNADGTSRKEVLPAGGEYRVYTFVSDNHGGAYGLGGGLFVDMHGALKYETPSKLKLALLK